jgi:hypothetical protein
MNYSSATRVTRIHFARTYRLGALQPFEGLFAADEFVTRRVGMEDRASPGKDNPLVGSIADADEGTLTFAPESVAGLVSIAGRSARTYRLGALEPAPDEFVTRRIGTEDRASATPESVAGLASIV